MTTTDSKADTVAILLFDDIEVLDFAGPFEVFSVTSELSGYKLFRVITVAPSAGSVRARNGLSVTPDTDMAGCPSADILIVPGGYGARALMEDQLLLDWIRKVHAGARYVLSVCTGSFLLGKCGLLDNVPAVTHHENLDELRAVAPLASIQPKRRFTGDGKIYTAGGIAAGIDLSFHIVAEMHGSEVAKKTADYMEYGPDWFSPLPWTKGD